MRLQCTWLHIMFARIGVVLLMLVVHGQCVIMSYNGTTTLDQQASVSVDTSRDSPDRTVPIRFPLRPVVFDNAYAGGGNMGVYLRPPHKYHLSRPPHSHHVHQSSHLQLPPPPHPPKYYPVEQASYNEEYYSPSGPEEDCSLLSPLVALKTALVALFKLAAAKLPLLAVKLVAKGLALLVVLGPLLLPLILLFPVPVFGFNGLGFGNGIGIPNGNNFNNNNNGQGNNFNNNNNGQGGNNGNFQGGNNGNLQGGNFQGSKFQSGGQGSRQAAVARLPQFAKGPCLPRVACEMGYWGYKHQVAWILDHATETATPNFPKLFNAWRRAYHQGGKGRDCATLYFCPSMDKVVAVATQNNLIAE